MGVDKNGLNFQSWLLKQGLVSRRRIRRAGEMAMITQQEKLTDRPRAPDRLAGWLRGHRHVREGHTSNLGLRDTSRRSVRCISRATSEPSENTNLARMTSLAPVARSASLVRADSSFGSILASCATTDTSKLSSRYFLGPFWSLKLCFNAYIVVTRYGFCF